MFINPSTLVAVLGLVSAAPAFAAPTRGSPLPSVRRGLASKLERRAEKLARQNNNKAGGGNAGNANAQTSLTLDPSQVAPGLAQNGQAGGGDPGQVASLTSTNNFINFCLTQNVPLTNGQQVKTGSCNAVPMGRIIGVNNMPTSKFSNPPNGAVIPANQAFTITMNINNLVTGNFVNPNTNYYSAPQQVDGAGNCIGHSHVTVELLPALASTQPLDNRKFAFFKGFNAAAQGGVLSAAVTAGLPAGAYRMCSINSAANHQPVLVAVAQRGSTDDCVYFTASNNAGGNAGNAGNAGGNAGNTGNAGNAGNAAGNAGNAGNAAGNAGNTGNAGNAGNAAGNTGNIGNTGNAGNAGNVGGNTGNAGNAGNNVATAVATSAAAAATTAAGNGAGRGGKTGGKTGGKGGKKNAAAATASSAAVAPAITSAAAAAPATGSTAGANGANLQTFTGALGGAPPAVTAAGQGFVVQGNNFVNKSAALQRSCDVQKNACANAANGSGNKAPLTVAACEKQATACTTASASA